VPGGRGKNVKYKLSDVCATEVEFDVVDGKLKNLVFSDGCPGNLRALSILLDDMRLEEIISKLKGITCGERTTSCADRLAKILEELK